MGTAQEIKGRKGMIRTLQFPVIETSHTRLIKVFDYQLHPRTKRTIKATRRVS